MRGNRFRREPSEVNSGSTLLVESVIICPIKEACEGARRRAVAVSKSGSLVNHLATLRRR